MIWPNHVKPYFSFLTRVGTYLHGRKGKKMVLKLNHTWLNMIFLDVQHLCSVVYYYIPEDTHKFRFCFCCSRFSVRKTVAVSSGLEFVTQPILQ